MMKAIVQHGYGAPCDVLRLAEVDTPAVGEHHVLVRVQASSANPWDWHFHSRRTRADAAGRYRRHS
jgi:NADPH:quinone reductase-like Zn-dependent oxidoreductase